MWRIGRISAVLHLSLVRRGPKVQVLPAAPHFKRGDSMPLPEGTKYRVKTTKAGKKVRLAWRKGHVIEAKNLKTGATHTPSEFAKDRAKAKARARKRRA